MADRINVVSDTIQEFMGARYYLCGNYFQRKGKRLHRAVWEHYNGDVPTGHHVHHVDGNRSNNDIDNLELIIGKAHLERHARTEERRENGRRAIRLAIEKAPEWHRSEEGKEWHSKHAKETWAKHKERERICTGCGEIYMSRDLGHKGNHFCHQNCKARYYRRMRNANREN